MFCVLKTSVLLALGGIAADSWGFSSVTEFSTQALAIDLPCYYAFLSRGEALVVVMGRGWTASHEQICAEWMGQELWLYE